MLTAGHFTRHGMHTIRLHKTYGLLLLLLLLHDLYSANFEDREGGVQCNEHLKNYYHNLCTPRLTLQGISALLRYIRKN